MEAPLRSSFLRRRLPKVSEPSCRMAQSGVSREPYLSEVAQNKKTSCMSSGGWLGNRPKDYRTVSTLPAPGAS